MEIQTFHYSDFTTFQNLAELKQRQNETISVVIPARNEETTIGTIVRTIHKSNRSNGLVDEIIVMDDHSEDNTAEAAEYSGARVVQVASAGPKTRHRGKGTALWKSQFIAKGSILIFIDSDLLDFNSNFITGLAGGLLYNQNLQLIKAAYSRPLKTDAELLENSGGRVTEILVRPLINKFLPELAELRQPLAGESALRRSTLENMHFYSGYGVEIGLLLEYFFTLGSQVIGQVELGTRSHRNRTLPELTRMAFEIGDVFFTYLERHEYCTFRYPRSKIIKTWESEEWNTSECGDFPLPPKTATESTVDHGT